MMSQKPEYTVIEQSDRNQLTKELNELASKGWKPILFTTSVSGITTFFHVILERIG